MFEKLYTNYLNMDKKVLTIQIIIYSCLTISFGYSAFSQIQRLLLIRQLQTFMEMKLTFSDLIIPVTSMVLLVCTLPQLFLMILVKLHIDPYYKDPRKEALKEKERERKRKAKRRKNRKFKNDDIISFTEAKKDL